VPSPSTELPRRGPERAWDAGLDGRVFIDRICAGAPEHLRPGGVLLLVQSAICGEAQTLTALGRAGLQARVAFRHVGKLGPRMREREDWLRDQGRALDGRDEVIVVRAQRV